MKLKPIPTNTVVHTPTEAEAKELLDILHANGYNFSPIYESLIKINGCYGYPLAMCFEFDEHHRIDHCYRSYYENLGYTILTLAEFKERYCEEQKPQPKYHLGERVRIISSGEEDFINMITEDDCYKLLEHRGKYMESELEPYAEPETTPTEDMETKEHRNLSQEVANCDKSEGKELNLCELLDNGDLLCSLFYSPAFGEVSFEENRASEGEIEIETKTEGVIFVLDQNGRIANEDGVCILFPSRALYEQYPLDPYTAWMKWQKEQKKPFICIHWGEVDCNGDEEEDYTGNIYFRTTSDRDKCINEIKAIINKYS